MAVDWRQCKHQCKQARSRLAFVRQRRGVAAVEASGRDPPNAAGRVQCPRKCRRLSRRCRYQSRADDSITLRLDEASPGRRRAGPDPPWTQDDATATSIHLIRGHPSKSVRARHRRRGGAGSIESGRRVETRPTQLEVASARGSAGVSRYASATSLAQMTASRCGSMRPRPAVVGRVSTRRGRCARPLPTAALALTVETAIAHWS